MEIILVLFGAALLWGVRKYLAATPKTKKVIQDPLVTLLLSSGDPVVTDAVGASIIEWMEMFRDELAEKGIEWGLAYSLLSDQQTYKLTKGSAEVRIAFNPSTKRKEIFIHHLGGCEMFVPGEDVLAGLSHEDTVRVLLNGLIDLLYATTTGKYDVKIGPSVHLIEVPHSSTK